MFSRTLRIAVVLLFAFSIVSCVTPAPPASGPLPASPSSSDAGTAAPDPAAPSPSGAADPAATVEEPAPVEPVLVFSQPPNPDGGLIPSSFADPGGNFTNQWAWESFSFDTIQSIAEVRWRGAYDPKFRGSGGPVGDFTVEIYPSIALGSEPDVANGPIVRYEVGGNAEETSAEEANGMQMFDYRFALPVPFEAAAFTPYWVQVEARQSGRPDWALAKGTRGDAQHYRRVLGGTSNIYQYAPGDAALDLLALGIAGETPGGADPAVAQREVTQEPLPPAEVAAINAEGVQEVQLVVSRSGYTPTHFSVKAGVPVRVVFRQLGYVPGGNILLVRWGAQEEQYLVLSSLTDKQVLEFTPQEPGAYRFNCPHDWYEGLMTVE